MAVRAVVFDLDGTLASFNVDYKAVRADVRDFLMRSGLPGSVLRVNESIFEMLKKAEIFLKNHGKPKKAIEETRQKALAVAGKYEYEASKTTSMLPGVLETLKALKRMRLKMGICTINSEKSTNNVLERFGVAQFFDAVTPRDKVKYVKPNVEHLEAALKALGVKPAETVVVGDGVGDMRSAKDLGAVAVGLSTGLSSPKELSNAGADYLITSITDLPDLVESVNAASGHEAKS